MRTKNGSVRELIAGIRQAAEQEEYNPAEDLKTLQTQYKRLGKKDFGLMLDAMVEKYAAGEYAAIHAALVEKAQCRPMAKHDGVAEVLALGRFKPCTQAVGHIG